MNLIGKVELMQMSGFTDELANRCARVAESQEPKL